ncbi:MAG: FAD-dependent oxidoreductase [Clostridia bacterium]|nr:FAD-dependent oxidoreductase [Clostridia bacterium]
MQIEYKKQLDIKYTADVLVAGGGPAGVAAAVAAARQGKQVIIVEQSGTFGGSSMLACVPELMNFDDGEKFICHGIGQEVFEELALQSEYKREWYCIKPEKLKRVYDKLILDAGVKVLFYTKLVDAVMDGGKIRQVVLSGVEGVYAVEAKMYIDCTGNAGLCALAGADYEYGDENGRAMSATLCSIWGGVDFSKKPRDANAYKQAYADGIFSQYDTALPGIKPNFPEIGVGEGNIGHSFGVDDTDTESLTEATFTGRRILPEYEVYYHKYVAGCENAQLIKSADFIGIRESRRVKCLYKLNKDDFFKKESFPDEIGRYSYPIDIHPMTSDEQGMKDFYQAVSMKHEAGGTYSIPYRSLVPERHENLLVAGRTIGTDHYMQATTRVIPCCYITGQAAGVAAAVCVEDNTDVRTADVKKIQSRLPQWEA